MGHFSLKNILKAVLPVLMAATAVCGVTGCKTDAKYKTSHVHLDMEIVQKSCGFIEAKFHTNRDAYYYISIEKVREGVDPMQRETQFKTLALDYAYKEYINWRYDLLYNGVKHIAEFSSHCLQYGDQDYFFTGLDADTDYWVFAFVVDPNTNSPAGDLILQTVHTDATSKRKIHFNYRVNDTWDFVYPIDESGELTFVMPWLGETMDSVKLRDDLKVAAPGRYFAQRFQELRESKDRHLFYGMYAHNNDGFGDGTSDTEFEEGHTYYTAVASFDGPLVMEGEFRNWNIYKISRWHQGMKQSYGIEDDTLGAW